ncbi:MAG: hypothetical protein R2857_14150 [Vampirovibrionales bacterium]
MNCPCSEDPKYSLDQVANTIAQDETLSLKILLETGQLGTVSRNTKILTIEDALVLIGTPQHQVINFCRTCSRPPKWPLPRFSSSFGNRPCSQPCSPSRLP